MVNIAKEIRAPRFKARLMHMDIDEAPLTSEETDVGAPDESVADRRGEWKLDVAVGHRVIDVEVLLNP